MIQLLSQGAVLLVLLYAGALALVLGVLLLVLYRRTVGRLMRSVASAAGPGGEREGGGGARRVPAARLTCAVESAEPAPAKLPPGSAMPVDAALRGAAIHAAAGAAFGLVATALLFTFSGTGFLPLRTASVAWAYAWPTVLALNLLWGPDRRRQLATVVGYAGVLALLCLWSVFTDSLPTRIGPVAFPAFANPALIWAIYAAPSAFLLLFLNRTVRAIGPLLLIFAALVFLGRHVALVALGTPIGQQAAYWAFTSTGIGAESLWLAVSGAGLAVGAGLGWLTIDRLAGDYAARRFSEQMLIVDTIWLLQALVLCSGLVFERGPLGMAGLLAFAAYKAVTVVGFRRLSAGLDPKPSRLLLLRVFGFGRRSSRLMDLIAARWRYVGSIDLIAAPDLAARTIEPGKLLAFVRGRLGRLFVRDQGELARRLAAIDDRRDPDGRFRVNELFCAGDVWRSAVQALMADAHLVVMDLRGFGRQHQGCVFELQALLDVVPLERLVLVVDGTTELAFLEQVLDARWRELRVDSPNAGTAAAPTVRLIQAGGSDAAIARRLTRLGAATRAPAAPPGALRPAA
jgi:hypothetical protein